MFNPFKKLELIETESAFDRLQRLAESQMLASLHWSETSTQPTFSGATSWQVTLGTISTRFLKMQAHSRADSRAGPVRTEGLLIPIGADLAVIVAGFDKQGFAAIYTRGRRRVGHDGGMGGRSVLARTSRIHHAVRAAA